MTLAVNIAQGASNNVTFRNRIINGACVIDQRNAGASVSPNTSVDVYPVDRFAMQASQNSKLTAQQVTTAPTGFKNSIKVTSSSAYSVGTNDYFNIYQKVEGYNVADMAFGTSGAFTFTFSFWVQCSLTGTFGGSFFNNAFNRSYPFTYTINSANTWEYKTVTIAGDQSGTWPTDNSTGIGFCFGLGVGTTYSGTAGAWTGSGKFSVTGATSVVGTSGATFYVTGVQLEAGTTASPFEYRQYGQELALCQRYYAKMGQGSASYAAFGAGMYYATTSTNLFVKYPTTMRASPTLSYGGTICVASGTSSNNITAVNNTYMGLDSCLWQPSGMSGTIGYGATMFGNNDNTSFVAFSAEL